MSGARGSAPGGPDRKDVPLSIGALNGRLTVDDSFFDPLPESEMAGWGG